MCKAVGSGVGGVEGLKPEKCCSKCTVAKKDQLKSAVGITIQGAKRRGGCFHENGENRR